MRKGSRHVRTSRPALFYRSSQLDQDSISHFYMDQSEWVVAAPSRISVCRILPPVEPAHAIAALVVTAATRRTVTALVGIRPSLRTGFHGVHGSFEMITFMAFSRIALPKVL